MNYSQGRHIHDADSHVMETLDWLDPYLETDSARGTPGTFMWLIEEIGELATTLQKIKGEGGDTSGGSTHEDLEGEFADVLAWLSTLASMNGIDLQDVADAKYGRGCPRCTATPCNAGSRPRTR